MPGVSGDLSIQLSLHATKWWLIAPLDIGGLITVDMVIDTGSPISAISERLFNRLIQTGHHESVAARTYILRDLRIQQQPISDLRVRLSRRVTSVGADGVLGLDFLARFTEIHFDVRTLRLTLTAM